MVGRTAVAVAAVLVLGGAAAAGAVTFTDVLDTGSPPAVDQVPGGVDVVVQVDGEILTDETTRRLSNGAAETTPGGPETNVSEALSKFENETGLDTAGFREAVAYGQMPDEGFMGTSREAYGGVIVHADWDNEAIIAEARNESTVELREETYNGQPIYRPATEPEYGSATTYGELGDGQVVMGTEAAVEDAIDVTQGDAPALEGDLRAAYDATPDGLVEFASRVPTEQVPEGGMGTGVDVSQFRRVDVVSGAYYTGSTDVGVEFHLHANAESDAQDVHDVIDGGISVLTGTTTSERAKDHLRSIEVERDGTTVLVTYERSVESIQELLEHYRDRGRTGTSGA